MQTMTAPATDKQIAFLTKLANERGDQGLAAIAMMNAGIVPTRRLASTMIDALLKVPAVTKCGDITAGMYRTADGSIFKVQESQTGSFYAKQLTKIGGERLTENDETVRWEFAYAPGAIRSITSADRMTIEDAKRFGIQFGVCCVCGKLLKDAKSVAAGIGPVCGRNV